MIYIIIILLIVLIFEFFLLYKKKDCLPLDKLNNIDNKNIKSISFSITYFVPVIGQVISRFLFLSDEIKSKNLWLLFIPIFWFPPFSAIPAYFIYNWINEGNILDQSKFNL